MPVDYTKKAIVRLMPTQPGLISMDLIVYGVEPAQLMTAPNSVINSLAAKYPGYTSSPFLVTG